MKRLIAVSLVVVLCICGLLVGCKDKGSANMLVSGGRPLGDTLTGIVIPDEDDLAGHIDLAYWLYDNANKLDQTCDKRIATSYCPVTTTIGIIEVTVEAFVYDIKNGEEYLLLEYQVARSGLGALASMFSKDMVFGKRSYYALGMQEMITHTVYNASMQGEKPISDWDDLIVASYEPPYFHASQELLYEKTDIIINLETIISAKVVYDEEQGIYIIEMELDVDNPLTTSKTIDNLKEGAGNKAKYTSITEYIEIWDNGYFKYFLSTDKWESGSLKAVLPYETTYSYYDDDCDIHAFEEVEGLISLSE